MNVNTQPAVRVNIGKEFSRYPAGRYIADGPNSGERFREEFLLPRLQRNEQVVVELDDTAGYGSSFLEEAFGGLIRRNADPKKVLQLLTLETEDESLKQEIEGYIKDEIGRLKKQ